MVDRNRFREGRLVQFNLQLRRCIVIIITSAYVFAFDSLSVCLSAGCCRRILFDEFFGGVVATYDLILVIRISIQIQD